MLKASEDGSLGRLDGASRKDGDLYGYLQENAHMFILRLLSMQT